VADNLALFDKALEGIHSERFGNLRQVLGLQDKLGRERGASKVNPAMIGKPSGKVRRKPVSVAVALAVGRARRDKPARKRACAVLAGTVKPLDWQGVMRPLPESV
jgi:hypothetical protein